MPRPSPQKRRRAYSDRAALRAVERPERAPRAVSLDLRPALTTTTIPGVVILPLRLFLAVTFIYAGIQKISDPGFLTLGQPTYIGTQLHGFAHASPIGGFFSPLLEHSVAVGWLTIFTELAIGSLILLGLFTRGVALVGLGLNFIFFLSASWHVYPYFLGSDIVFVMAWLTLALAGPGGYDLDAVVEGRLRPILPFGLGHLLFASSPHEVRADAAEDEPVLPAPRRGPAISRGEALIGGLATGVLILLGLSSKGSVYGGTVASAPQPTAAPTQAPGTSPAPTPTAVTGGAVVGTTSQIPANSALATTDPKTGDPAVVVHTQNNQFVAYDAVCTHAGCTVQYDPQYKLLVCPCHGGAFDPAQNANVVAGPPPGPLAPLPIHIDASGNISLV